MAAAEGLESSRSGVVITRRRISQSRGSALPKYVPVRQALEYLKLPNGRALTGLARESRASGDMLRGARQSYPPCAVLSYWTEA